MKNDDKPTRKQLIQSILSVIAIFALVFLCIFALNGGFSQRNKKELVSATSKNTNLTPQQTVQKFIFSAGNMGNVRRLNYQELRNGDALNSMEANRMQALNQAINYVSTESDYMQNYSNKDIDRFASETSIPTYFAVPKNSIFITRPLSVKNTTITGLNGKTINYRTVKLKASFVSNVYNFNQTGSDTSWNGDFRINKSSKTFPNVTFTLVKQDGKWKIFHISDLGEISTRFATWEPGVQHHATIIFHTIGTLKKGESLDGIR